LLLRHSANPRISSDGGWTALHNAAEKGHLKVVEFLLAAGANVNAELSNGMTALHWAAQNGHEEVVKAILTRPDAKLSVKDSFDRTPMLCAAEQGHRDIVYLLSPGKNGDRLSAAALGACESFEATVVDFGIDAVLRERKQRVLKNSVYDLIYGWDATNNKPKVPTQVKNIKVNPSFRWIHIPANNLAWVEAMLTKAFVEAGHKEIDDFKALEKCFSQEHRGAQVHASFMRPYCHRIPPMSVAKAYTPVPESPIILQEEGGNGGGAPKTPLIYVEPATPGSTPLKGSLATLPDKGEKSDKSDRENTPKSDKKKTKSEKLAERHGKKGGKTDSPSGKGTPSKVKGGERHPHPKPKAVPIPSLPSGKLVLFMPFLHYESDKSREKMSRAIKRTYIHNDPALRAPELLTPDDLLIEAYLSSTPALHARRTLDQFFYHGIDTSERDQDQVVYRYCKRRNLERKVFMVDQLWMWILGKDLIITSFPQRWQQPKNDPLNVLDGIIEDMNAKTRPPVKSVYDLAMLITSRCSGMFDRHRFDDENYQFIDMFESSIGHVTNKETKLFARFNRASAVAGEWLRYNRRGRGARRILLGKSDIKDDEDHNDDNDPIFVDTLLDIGTETKLLAEIKDIRDELNIIRMVLTSQLNILPDLADHIGDELGGKRTIEAGELRKRSKEQMKIIEVHIKDLDRMDKQADLIYNSLTHLLDLKQKHANAFEARFARDQAALTARQGQTIMVFTIVTIFFLPMSFIATVFNINIAEFQRVGEQFEIPFNYVAKYMFGIGLGISIPLIFLAFAVDDVINLAKRIAYFVMSLIPGLPRQKEEVSNRADQALWTRRYSESRYSAETEKQRAKTEVWDAPPRSSLQRDISPMSHRTARSTLHGNHVSWNRSSYERGRPSDDI
jgi:Mg2+ and Co2+ transporter CorA